MNPTILAGGLGLALTGLLGYNLIYVPHKAQVDLIRVQIVEEQRNQQMQAEVAALLDQIEQYRTRLPHEADPSWLVREVVALARQAGLGVDAIDQSPPQTFGTFTRLSATIQVTASYHQLGALLDYIEQSDHFIDVERVSVKESSYGGPMSTQLTLSTFYVPKVMDP